MRMYWEPTTPTSVRAAGTRHTAATLSRTSAVSDVPSSGSVSGRGPGMPTTRKAPTIVIAASTAVASSGPPRPSSTPVSAGATSTLAFSIQLETTFAAVSSSGLRTTLGSSAACAGRGMERPRFMIGASTYTSQLGAPRNMASASPAMVAPMISRPQNSTRPARARSVIAPRYGATKMHGTSCTRMMRLTAAAPPFV
jgi:hypothetical protein